MKKILTPLGYALIVLAALWISAEVRLRQLRHRLANLWTYTVHFKVVDEASGAPLPPWVSHLSPDENNLPFILAGGEPGQYEFTITSDIPVSFRFSPPGYIDKRVSIDRNSPTDLEIRLSKK